MEKKNDKYDTAEDTTTGAPVCEKCGNILIKESLSDAQNELTDSGEGSWVCPHCQGEIDFLGDDDE